VVLENFSTGILPYLLITVVHAWQRVAMDQSNQELIKACKRPRGVAVLDFRDRENIKSMNLVVIA